MKKKRFSVEQIVVRLFLPETRGKTLEEIEKYFEGGGKAGHGQSRRARTLPPRGESAWMLRIIAEPLRIRTGMMMLIPVLLSGAAGHTQIIAPLPGGAGYKGANSRISAQLDLSNGMVRSLLVTDLASSQTIALRELFSITLEDGAVLRSSEMKWQRPRVTPAPTAASGERDGKQLCADFEGMRVEAEFQWCLVIRSDTSYLQSELTIHVGTAELPMTEVRLLDFHDPEARVVGTVPGSPLVDGRMFLGFENPLSWSRIASGEATASISRVLPLHVGQTAEYSAVIGSAASGQMRRSFLNYLESERPRSYRPFLLYNSWYDIGYGNRYDEAAALNRIDAFGTELADRRGIKLDSFLFDDGWDNPDSLWEFNNGFPDGFTRVSQEAAKYGAGIGVWLSPWGGYGEEKKQRIAFGRSHGYEIINDGYALSGPKYFHAFDQVCQEMIERYGVNQFKLDGTGNADRVFPGSAFDSDFDAAIHLIKDLREEKRGVFINLTNGTWASPFWLLYADSIWRGGEDHDFAGVGTSRQRWITFRDDQTYQNIVERGPLFPLSSLMLHGIIYAAQAEGLNTDPAGDFEDEVHAYFASGTQLQEIYITPSLLTPADWDDLAKYARWSRQHADILKDTHWIGGDPGKLEVYGWAAWSQSGWVITLRNPSDHPQSYVLQLCGALELPSGEPGDYLVREPFSRTRPPAVHWSAGNIVSVSLRPFEIRTFESAKQ